MLKKISCDKDNFKKKLKIYVSQGNIENKKRSKLVSTIINDVKQYGDKALKKYSKKFDGFNINNPNNFLVTKEEFKAGLNTCSKEFIKSINLAAKRIQKYQKKLLPFYQAGK